MNTVIQKYIFDFISIHEVVDIKKRTISQKISSLFLLFETHIFLLIDSIGSILYSIMDRFD